MLPYPLPRLGSACVLMSALGCDDPSGDDLHREAASSVVATRPSAAVTPSPATASSSPTTVRVPEPFVAITGRDLIGLIRQADTEGAVVNAWASWCGPCKRELPMLASLRTKVPRVSVLFVSVDQPDAWQTAADILREHGISDGAYVVVERLGSFKARMHPGWQGMIPATFLFDASGRRRYFWGGPVYEKELLPVVEGFLRGENIDGEARFGLAPGKVEN